MFQVVEFAELSGGGLGLVRTDWLTPRKKECFWPPHKLATQYNRSLTEDKLPGTDWKLYELKRVFYVTDDLLKAREKLKEAESESEIQTDCDSSIKRKRKPNRKLIVSSSDEGEYSTTCNRPKKKTTSPPSLTSALPSTSNFSALTFNNLSDRISASQSTSKAVTPPNPASTNLSNQISASQSTPKAVTPPNPASTNSSSRNRTEIEPLNTTPTPASPSLQVIARCLAAIEKRIDTVVANQQLILNTLNIEGQNETDTDLNVKLPCETHDDVENLEHWILETKNQKGLERALSLRGGKTTKVVVQRILEKLMTNQLALEYNWTGKHGKRPLRNLKFMDIVQRAVRRNPLTAASTDQDITSIVQSWFRFVKDRDGGRDRRRKRTEENQVL